MTVYRHWGGCALGDAWCIASWLLRRSEETGKPALISRHVPANRDYGADKFREILPQCAAMMDSPGSIELVDWNGQTTPIEGHWGHARHRMHDPYLRWWDGSDGTVCYQLDGHSGAEQKNPPAKDLYQLMSFPKMVRVGLPLTLEESARELSRCRLFIGVCSGMSHVAHSVGCPMIVVEYGQKVQPWHPPEGSLFQIARGTDDAMRLARMSLGAYA